MSNQETVKSGLNFNVKYFKTHLKKYYEKRNVYVTVVKEGKEEKKLPMISGSHVATTAIIESLTHYILSNIKDRVKQDKTNLRRLDRPTLRTFILESDDELKKFFLSYDSLFDSSRDYDEGFSVTKKDFTTYINTFMGTEFYLTEKAFNYFYFIISTVFYQLADRAKILMLYAKKRTINSSCMTAALETMFDEKLSHIIINNVHKAMTLYNHKDEEKDEEKNEEKNEEKDKKKSKKDSDKEDSDKEDSDKEDSDKEDSDKEDSDKEDSDKEEPVKKSSKKAKKDKKTKKSTKIDVQSDSGSDSDSDSE